MRLLDVGGEGLGGVEVEAGEVDGERESEEGEGGDCGSGPGGWLEMAERLGAKKLGGQGEGKKAEGGELLVVPAGALSGVGEVRRETSDKENKGGGAATAREEDRGESGDEENLELEGLN